MVSSKSVFAFVIFGFIIYISRWNTISHEKII